MSTQNAKPYSPYGIAHPQKSFENGRAGTTTLDMHTGDLMHIHTDVALDGIRMPLNVAHVYHASDRQAEIESGLSSVFGRGWRITPVETLTVSPGSSPYAVYCDGTGMEYSFYAASTSTGTVIGDDLGLGLTLKENVTGYLDLTDKQGNLKRFERVASTGTKTTYRIKLIKNTNGVTWGYSYTADGKLNAVTDGSGRSASMIYSSSTGTLTQMRYRPTPGAEKLIIAYAYNTNGDLISITYPDGSVTRFAYLEEGTPPNVHDLFATVNPETGLRQEYSKVGGTGDNAISWFNHVQSFMPTRYEENGAEPSASPEMKAGERVNLTKSESICTVGVPGKAHEIYKTDAEGRTVLTYTNLSYNRKSDDALLDVRTPATVYEYGTYTTLTSGFGGFNPSRVVLQASTGAVAHKLVNGELVDDNPNLLKDSMFLDSWESGENGGWSCTTNTDFINFYEPETPIFDGENCYELAIERTGATSSTPVTCVEQTVSLSGVTLTENALVLSLWAKVLTAYSAPTTCKLTGTLTYTDGSTTVRSFTYDGNTDRRQLGAVALPITVGKTPASVKVTISMGEVGTAARFTGAMLTNEPATRITYADNTNYSITSCGSTVAIRSKVTRTDGHSTQVEEYDVYGNCVRITETDPSGNSWTSEAKYDAKQNVIKTKDYHGMITEYGYSTEGAQTSVKSYPYDSEGGTPTDFTYVSYVYDATRDCYKKAYGEDGTAIAEITDFDANGYPSKITSKGITAECSYDSMGRLLQYCVPDAVTPIRTITHTYTNGKQTKVTANGMYYDTRKVLPHEVLEGDEGTLKEARNYEREVMFIGTEEGGEKAYAPAMHWEFEPYDEAELKIEPVTYTYDGYGRVQKRLDRMEGKCYNYYYNRRGQVIREDVSDVESEEELYHRDFTYDAAGRLTVSRHSLLNGQENFTYETDENGAVYPDASVASTEKYGFVCSAQRDAFGRQIWTTAEFQRRFQIASDITYGVGNADGATGAQTSRPIAYVYSVCDDENTYEYTYDENGNIAAVSRNGELLVCYGYDDLGQLIREDNAELESTFLHAYHANGNRNTASRAGYTPSGEDVDSDETYTFSYVSDWCDQLSELEDHPVQYDKFGNPFEYGEHILTWSGRLLTAYGEDVTFGYNASGARIRKTAENTVTEYILDGTRILRENRLINGDIASYFAYIYGADGTLIGFIHNGVYYYYGKNLFGDIVDIYNVTGTKVAHYAYDAWGNHEVRNPDGTKNDASDFIGNINPFRYRGYYYDTETGFYYLQTRYYDPRTGRFINADALSYLGADGELHGYNLYTYCGNNPVMRADPTGTAFQWWDPSTWNLDTGDVIDLVIGAIAFGAGVLAARDAFLASVAFYGPVFGGIAGLVNGAAAFAATSGAINNTVNGIYYTFFAKTDSPYTVDELNKDVLTSAYVDDYISRWERLDHTKTALMKHKADDPDFNISWLANGKMYYAEYNVHMLGWYVAEACRVLDLPFLASERDNLEKAHIIPGDMHKDNVDITVFCIKIAMLLGW